MCSVKLQQKFVARLIAQEHHTDQTYRSVTIWIVVSRLYYVFIAVNDGIFDFVFSYSPHWVCFHKLVVYVTFKVDKKCSTYFTSEVGIDWFLAGHKVFLFIRCYFCLIRNRNVFPKTSKNQPCFLSLCTEQTFEALLPLCWHRPRKITWPVKALIWKQIVNLDKTWEDGYVTTKAVLRSVLYSASKQPCPSCLLVNITNKTRPVTQLFTSIGLLLLSIVN